jgi:hypothetical protein
MKESPDDIGSFCSQLNWRGSTRIAELGGAFPITAPVNHNLPCFNLFSIQREQPWAREELWKGWVARRDVLRGFSQVDMQVYATWTQRCVLQEPFLRKWVSLCVALLPVHHARSASIIAYMHLHTRSPRHSHPYSSRLL